MGTVRVVLSDGVCSRGSRIYTTLQPCLRSRLSAGFTGATAGEWDSEEWEKCVVCGSCPMTYIRRLYTIAQCLSISNIIPANTFFFFRGIHDVYINPLFIRILLYSRKKYEGTWTEERGQPTSSHSPLCRRINDRPNSQVVFCPAATTAQGRGEEFFLPLGLILLELLVIEMKMNCVNEWSSRIMSNLSTRRGCPEVGIWEATTLCHNYDYPYRWWSRTRVLSRDRYT